MSASTMSQEPPESVVEILDDLDAQTLRGVRSYTDQRLEELRHASEEKIRSEAAGEIVDILDCGAYRLVKMYPPTGDDRETTSRSVLLYRVKHERRTTGDETLHWSYLGEITDRASVENRNGGELPSTPDTESLPVGEEESETTRGDSMSYPLTEHLVVPVATAEDARATAIALKQLPYNRLTVVHVVEKAGGAPDKLSLEQAERRGADSFAAFREVIPDIETEVTYARDVVEAINDLAIDLDASAIAFRPRGGSRLVQLISGDKALRLVTEPDLPVITLHCSEEEER